MQKQSTIAITLGLSIIFLAMAISFLPLQQPASAGKISKPEAPRSPPTANPAGSNMTIPAANTTGRHETQSDELKANPAGDHKVDHGPRPPKANPAGSNMTTGSNMTGPAANTTGGTPTANPAGTKSPHLHVPLPFWFTK